VVLNINEIFIMAMIGCHILITLCNLNCNQSVSAID